jgi:hypothetical protein
MAELPQHNYIGGVCEVCGDRQADNLSRDRLCKRPAVPSHRSIPVSVFAEIDPIYSRIQELRRERDALLSQTTTIEP